MKTMKVICYLLIFYCVLFSSYASENDNNGMIKEGDKVQYVIIVDAGSTGSRGFVYKITKSSSQNEVKIDNVMRKGLKMTPGISSFVENLAGIRSYYVPLFVKAATAIPVEYQSSTEVHVLGTAGMRLISEKDQNSIWDRVVNDLNADDDVVFDISRENVRTINGHEEAYYAALSTNYLAKKINSNLMPIDNAKLVGALDMGGSSTQLVLHTGTPPGQRVQESHFWSHSWLSYGVDKIRERVWHSFVEAAVSPHINTSNSTKVIDNDNSDIYIAVGSNDRPTHSVLNDCLFKSYTELYFDPADSNKDIYALHGTGNVEKCKEALRNVLWPEGCIRNVSRPSCSLDNIEHPPIAGSNFYGMSVYYFALDCVRYLGVKELTHWPISNIRELIEAATAFCEMDWHDVNGTYSHSVNAKKGKHRKTSADSLPYRCLEALYLSILLEEGFGFDLDQRSLTLTLKVEDVEVEWTLGVLLSRVSSFFSIDNTSVTDLKDSVKQNPIQESIYLTGVDHSHTDHSADIHIADTNDNNKKADSMHERLVDDADDVMSSKHGDGEQGNNSYKDNNKKDSGGVDESDASIIEEGIINRIRALKAAGLNAHTLKKLFPDVSMDDLFGGDDNNVESDGQNNSESNADGSNQSHPFKSDRNGEHSFLSRMHNFKSLFNEKVIKPVKVAKKSFVQISKRVYNHIEKSFEMFSQAMSIPLEFIIGRSRYAGRWLYRKIFELIHKRPL